MSPPNLFLTDIYVRFIRDVNVCLQNDDIIKKLSTREKNIKSRCLIVLKYQYTTWEESHKGKEKDVKENVKQKSLRVVMGMGEVSLPFLS